MTERYGRSLIILWVSLAFLAFVNLVSGAVSLPLSDVIRCLWIYAVDGSASAQEAYPKAYAIVIHIRLPRTLAAVLAGSALALSGAAMQGLFRNPLASPDILGISAGSALGAVVGIALGLSSLHPMVTPVFSILGALFTAVIVFWLAGRTGSVNLLFIILAGLALSSLLSGATSAVLLFSQEYEVAQFIFWTMGGLDGRMWSHVLWPAPLILILIAITLRQGAALNLLSQGEENAHGMGLDIRRTKIVILLVTAGLTSLAISITGPIGFIGLMVPHLVRILTGPDHRQLLLLSALTGGLIVMLADLIGRTVVAPYEIKVGIITSMVGGSYFILLILRLFRQGRWAL